MTFSLFLSYTCHPERTRGDPDFMSYAGAGQLTSLDQPETTRLLPRSLAQFRVFHGCEVGTRRKPGAPRRAATMSTSRAPGKGTSASTPVRVRRPKRGMTVAGGRTP